MHSVRVSTHSVTTSLLFDTRMQHSSPSGDGTVGRLRTSNELNHCIHSVCVCNSTCNFIESKGDIPVMCVAISRHLLLRRIMLPIHY